MGESASGVSGGSSGSFTGTERILAFSDGVFAIAITLLVLDLTVPKIAAHAAHFDLGASLLDEWPNYLSYILSFLFIGIVWANHHQIFTQIRRSNHVFLLINVLFLMWVAVLPFPTALLGEYLTSPNQAERHLVTEIYTGIWLLGALLFNLLWWYGVHGQRLTDETIHRGIVRRTTWSYYIGPISYLIAFVLSFLSVEASLVVSFLLAVFYALAPLLPTSSLTRPSS